MRENEILLTKSRTELEKKKIEFEKRALEHQRAELENIHQNEILKARQDLERDRVRFWSERYDFERQRRHLKDERGNLERERRDIENEKAKFNEIQRRDEQPQSSPNPQAARSLRSRISEGPRPRDEVHPLFFNSNKTRPGDVPPPKNYALDPESDPEPDAELENIFVPSPVRQKQNRVQVQDRKSFPPY